MTKETALQLFEQKQVRSLWNEDEEKWYFSIVDVIGVLSESLLTQQIIGKLKNQIKRIELGSYIGDKLSPD